MAPAWAPSTLEDLTRYCQKLTQFRTAGARYASSHSLARTAALPERIAAIHSLNTLTALQQLEFRPSEDSELAALAAATPALRELTIAVCQDSQVTNAGLMHLAALRQLQKLALCLFRLEMTQDSMQQLMAALIHVDEWRMVVSTRAQATMVRAGLRWMQNIGLHRLRPSSARLPQIRRIQRMLRMLLRCEVERGGATM